MFSGKESRPSLAANTAPRRRAVVWIKALFVVAVLATVAALSLGVARKWWLREPVPVGPATDDPRVTFDTPFRNVRPEVQYVGDDACAECHAGHTARYHQHPMGRSLAPVAQVDLIERFGLETHNPFEARGGTFEVAHRDREVFHKEIHRDAHGKEIAALEAEVQFALGSGRQGRSYLINRDGFLTQSAISWYSGERIWDLSPGYKENFLGFARQITVDCLFCHSNQVNHVDHSINHYQQPIFHGYAIGCERCHGPGQLHVESRARGEHPEGTDFTIVNPRHLEPILRDSVCEQCHLQGEMSVSRRGRNLFDYRPGLPFHLYRSTFVLKSESAGRHKSVGHVQQMYASRCFQESKGRLGCISCHDPHELPAPEKRVAFFRDRCLQCHEDSNGGSKAAVSRGADAAAHEGANAGACSLPLEVRREKNAADSCIECHMPHVSSANIVHAAVTDHRIVRRPDDPQRPAREEAPSEIPLANFHRDLFKPGDPAADRDLGVAMIRMGRLYNFDAVAQRVGRTALPLLGNAVEDGPNDVEAWESRGYALWLAGRRKDALAACEKALALAPGREVALRDAAFFAANLHQKDKAVAYWTQLLAVNPWEVATYFNLGKVAAEREDWTEALRQSQAALRIDPTSTDARTLLVLVYAKTGQPARARTEFEALLALKPPKEEELRQWFAGLDLP